MRNENETRGTRRTAAWTGQEFQKRGRVCRGIAQEDSRRKARAFIRRRVIVRAKYAKRAAVFRGQRVGLFIFRPCTTLQRPCILSLPPPKHDRYVRARPTAKNSAPKHQPGQKSFRTAVNSVNSSTLLSNDVWLTARGSIVSCWLAETQL